ncbi:hypothetical protein H4R19_002289 [Coemansia spiralis]|nr:hypothetical protein H4R19_002289 [Coemansia spiralis]
MQLGDLPEDIQIIILRQCLSDEYDKAQEFTSNLPLLAVCRLWRHLAIPMVYKHAFARYGKRPKFRGDTSTRDPGADEPSDVAVKTNLGLIAVVGCVSAVRSLKIEVYCLANPFPGWQDVIQRMRAVASWWRVVELTVAMNPDSNYFDGRNVDMAKYANDIAEVGDALAALIPTVQHVPPDRQFTKLHDVNISFDRIADYQLPRMASAKADSSSQVIEFAKLKSLYVSSDEASMENDSAVHHRDGHPWELRFPGLQSLYIDCRQGICPLLEYAVLPPHMESIHVDLKSATFQQLADVMLPKAKKVSLIVSQWSGGDPSGLRAVNRLIESACGSESLGLKIMDDELELGPESITCTSLTRLLVSGQTSMDTMLAFIERLPNLVKLVFYSLDPSDLQTDISVPSADEEAIVEPLSTSLRELTVGYGRVQYSPDTAVAVAKYALLRVPMLTKLLAARTPEEDVLDFVDAYAPRYPHLYGVQLRLYEDDAISNIWFDSDM